MKYKTHRNVIINHLGDPSNCHFKTTFLNFLVKMYRKHKLMRRKGIPVWYTCIIPCATTLMYISDKNPHNLPANSINRFEDSFSKQTVQQLNTPKCQIHHQLHRITVLIPLHKPPHVTMQAGTSSGLKYSCTYIITPVESTTISFYNFTPDGQLSHSHQCYAKWWDH